MRVEYLGKKGHLTLHIIYPA
ncbi:hypothetical protein ACLK1X_09855 [Escherichia coli]